MCLKKAVLFPVAMACRIDLPRLLTLESHEGMRQQDPQHVC
jgi:hypothetical protein